MRFKIVMTFVNPEITEKVINTAKKAGATGDVVIPARGSGSSQATFLGVSIVDKTDILLFVVEEHIVNNLLDAISSECKLREPGNGIAVVLNVERVAGLEKQIENIKGKLRDENL
ncbi:nitrogen regulatory protein P-II family [Algoriphagus alkaliphilus]|uniref:Nitrogen regulatory protein P-II family n=1 Tax=Algoriphagus alkaliphilus TaxID=279824 RepID=A0A1G5XTG2_9BACT|nr:P-II family nitrogen regulator [Algoriphagus alkaliphilus]SDA73768.1 nitrogen regulatory protein P-II family [Algoriphagus alkaliphilus]